MFKKHAIAIAIGAMAGAPAVWADDTSTEGIIYQADQTGNLAEINQVQTDGNPQAAAILQVDDSHAGSTDTHNIGIVIQGAVGDNQNVSVDTTGAAPTSTTADLLVGGIPGTGVGTPPVIMDLSAYVDDNGNTPYEYDIQGATSFNYGLVVQNGQRNSQAVILQATGQEVDDAITNQNSFQSTDIAANGDTDTASATAGGAFDMIVQNYNSQSGGQGAVEVTYGAGTFGVDDGVNSIDFTGLASSIGVDAPDHTDGNLALITQGQHIGSLDTVNGTTIDADDSFIGNDDQTINQALALQGGTNGYVSIGQQGSLNAAIVAQLGDSNVGETYQYEGTSGSPLSEFSLIAQIGNNNVGQVYQAGAFNTSYAYQFGDGNIAQVEQTTDAAGASGAISFIYQSNAAGGADFGTGNYASVYQRDTSL